MTDKSTEAARLAAARDAFFASNSGTFLSGAPEGRYLRNRLEVAFIAGWDAKKADALPPVHGADDTLGK